LLVWTSALKLAPDLAQRALASVDGIGVGQRDGRDVGKHLLAASPGRWPRRIWRVRPRPIHGFRVLLDVLTSRSRAAWRW